MKYFVELSVISWLIKRLLSFPPLGGTSHPQLRILCQRSGRLRVLHNVLCALLNRDRISYSWNFLEPFFYRNTLVFVPLGLLWPSLSSSFSNFSYSFLAFFLMFLDIVCHLVLLHLSPVLTSGSCILPRCLLDRSELVCPSGWRTSTGSWPYSP